MNDFEAFTRMMERQSAEHRENRERIERELGEPDDTVVVTIDDQDITYGLWRVEGHVMVIGRGLKRWDWDGRRYVQDKMIEAMERLRTTVKPRV